MVVADNVEKSSLQHNTQEREGCGRSAAVEHSPCDHEVGGSYRIELISTSFFSNFQSQKIISVLKQAPHGAAAQLRVKQALLAQIE